MRTAIFGKAAPKTKPEDYEARECEGPQEDFGALYFKRIQRFPLLTEAEEQDLLERWCKFRDERAKDRIARAHLRMVPPIARRIAQKFGFEPFWNILPAGTQQDAFTGYQEVVSELTAAGNFGLANALEHFDPNKNFVFYTYARTCVQNAIVCRAKSLRSVVDRPFQQSAPYDLSMNPMKPDPHDFRDYVGSRANPTVSDDSEDDLADGRKVRLSRLRPYPKEPRNFDGEWRAGLMSSGPTPRGGVDLSPEESRVFAARMRGSTLKEIACDLGMSVATAWRREQQAVQKLARTEA